MKKVNMRGACLLQEGGRYFKAVSDPDTERLLNHIATRAEAKGMVINKKKTGLMCVSAATSFDSRVSVCVQDETIIGSSTMRILGVLLDKDCTFKSHVKNLRSRLRSKTWILSKLPKRGMSTEKLVHVYKTLIRPTVEYLAPAWTAMITAEQSENLERQQVQALKNIFGPNISANKMRQAADIDRLAERRRGLSLSFAKKCLTNSRTEHWFKERRAPCYARRTSVTYPKYHEDSARTDRHRNSPKNFLRRLLNEEK